MSWGDSSQNVLTIAKVKPLKNPGHVSARATVASSVLWVRISEADWLQLTETSSARFPFPHHWKLYAGVENRNAMPMLAQSATVTDVIAHTQFTTATYNNDVALIRIKENLTFNLKVRPICLPPNNHHFLNGTLWVDEWRVYFVVRNFAFGSNFFSRE